MENRTTVAQSYGTHTLVGNWFEESVLNEYKLKKFLRRQQKSNESTGSNFGETIASQGNGQVCLSKSRDGFIRYGDSIFLMSVSTQGLLTLSGGKVISSLANETAIPENLFVLEPYKNVKTREVCFGDAFYIRVHPAYSAEPLYLISEPINVSSGLKNRVQQVRLSRAATSDALWKAAFKNLDARFEADTQPILAECELVLQHVTTGQLLRSTNTGGATDFAVSVETGHSGGARSLIEKERNKGLVTDIPAHAEPVDNAWAILIQRA